MAVGTCTGLLIVIRFELRERGQLTVPIRGSYRKLHYGASVGAKRICLIFGVLPAKRHIPRVEPRGFEPLTSAVQKRIARFSILSS
jgi:hypothetical protein